VHVGEPLNSTLADNFKTEKQIAEPASVFVLMWELGFGSKKEQ